MKYYLLNNEIYNQCSFYRDLYDNNYYYYQCKNISNSNECGPNLTLENECDILSDFNGITVSVNDDCCQVTSENGNISCRNNHITEM